MSDKKCMAVTSDGESCNNKATFPEDNPIACHLKSHQKQLGLVDKIKEDKNMPKKVEETKKHVFASTCLTQTVYVDTDKEPEEKGERDYFRAEFKGGRYETDSDEKARLLEKKISQFKELKRRIKKLQ